MQLVIYRLVYPILWLISKLPWRIFYGFSTGVFILTYHIIGYRKKIVTQNLELVFPEKPAKEIKRIRRDFYKHMCDMFLEMIKSISISNEEMIKRFKVTNREDLSKIEAKDKHIIVLLGHYGSYEWSNVVDLQTKFQCVGIYKPIKNIYFDRLIHRIRGRFGSRVVSNKDVTKEMIRDQKSEQKYLYGLVADQTPKMDRAMYWTNFMDIKVPAFVGGEVMSKRLGHEIFYLQVEKVKRGYYEATFIPLNQDPENKTNFTASRHYMDLLENQIRKKPEFYLWTHKRWKHRNAKIPKGATVD